MIVDWRPEQRGDLEVAMREGIVVVAYDEKGFEILKDCRVDGTYGFMGMTRREQVVRLESADDIKANLPLGGIGIAAKLGGELEKGATLDIAMVMVGKVRTTWRAVGRDDLIGSCARASHVVRGGTVGAFAVDKGERTRARAVAEIFGAGASGGSAASGATRTTDGQIAACDGSAPDSPQAPKQCGAIMRVELLPVSTEGAHPRPRPAPEGIEVVVRDHENTALGCPKGFVSLNGKCTSEKQVVPAKTECKPGDVAACTAACDAGDGKGCYQLAMSLLANKEKDTSKIATALARGCKADDAQSCLTSGNALASGFDGGTRDLPRAYAAFSKACAGGESAGCYSAGGFALTGTGTKQDSPLAERLFRKGCDGGNDDSCNGYGVLMSGQSGFKANYPLAAKYFKRACDGDSVEGCENLGNMYEDGDGVAKNLNVAVKLYVKACAGDGCTGLARMFLLGKGVSKDETKAAELYTTACSKRHDVLACAVVRAYFDPKVAVDRVQGEAIATIWKNGCKAATPEHGAHDCSLLGALTMGLATTRENARDAKDLFAQGCKLGDEWGCAMGSRRAKRAFERDKDKDIAVTGMDSPNPNPNPTRITHASEALLTAPLRVTHAGAAAPSTTRKK
jgi:TPR repeat protein